MPGSTATARTSFLRKRARLASSHADRYGRPADEPEAVAAEVNGDSVTVRLSDGRAVSFPIAWSPRLLRGTPEERAEVDVTPDGVHWPQLDEDLSVRGILAGRGSRESAASVAEWEEHMDRRRAQIAAGEEPEPFGIVLPLPDWWDEDEEVSADT